jgi:hypothetical protein
MRAGETPIRGALRTARVVGLVVVRRRQRFRRPVVRRYPRPRLVTGCTSLVLYQPGPFAVEAEKLDGLSVVEAHLM